MVRLGFRRLLESKHMSVSLVFFLRDYLNISSYLLDTIQRGTVADPDSAASSTGTCIAAITTDLISY